MTDASTPTDAPTPVEAAATEEAATEEAAMEEAAMEAAATGESFDTSPRLAPIEHPSSWKTRLVYMLSRWQEGTVLTPLKVVWARMPEGLRLAYEMDKLEDRLTLDPELRFLVNAFVATINDCAFCRDLARAHAGDVPPKKWEELLQYDDSDAFNDAERTALAYAEEVTENVDASAETFEALRLHFSEREIVEMTWLVAQQNFYNRMNRPLGIGSDELCEANLGTTH